VLVQNIAVAALTRVSTHEICRRLSLARSTVRVTLKPAEGACLSWPPPGEMNDNWRRRFTPPGAANAGIGVSRSRIGPACIAN
jgi:hypothetical protein